jgi:hypothetical protein
MDEIKQQDHASRRSEYRKQYYIRSNGRDRNREAKRQYSLKNKDRQLDWRKRYYLENIEKIRADHRRYYLKNKEKRIKAAGIWKKAHPRRVKGYRVAKYGVTIEQYEAQLKEQNFCCAICRNPLDLKKDTHQDHCHASNKARGILCTNCNKGLGFLKDSISSFENAIEYLKRFA